MVDGPGDQLLARARLASEKDGRLGRGDLLHQTVDLAHGLGLAHQIGEAEALGDLALEKAVLPHQSAQLQGPADGQEHLVVLKGLTQVVEGTLLHRLHGLVHRAEGGHHNHRQIRLMLFDGGQELHSVQARHLHVGDDQVGLVLVQDPQGLLTRGGGQNLVALAAEQGLQYQEVVLFIIDNEYRLHLSPRSLSSPWSPPLGRRLSPPLRGGPR